MGLIASVRAHASALLGAFAIAAVIMFKVLVSTSARDKLIREQVQKGNEDAEAIRRDVSTGLDDRLREFEGRGYRD